MARVGAEVKEEDAFLHSHTVLDTFERMNSDSAAAKGIAFYYSFVPFGRSGDYPGAEPAGCLVSEKHSYLSQHRQTDRVAQREDSRDFWFWSSGMATTGRGERRERQAEEARRFHGEGINGEDAVGGSSRITPLNRWPRWESSRPGWWSLHSGHHGVPAFGSRRVADLLCTGSYIRGHSRSAADC